MGKDALTSPPYVFAALHVRNQQLTVPPRLSLTELGILLHRALEETRCSPGLLGATPKTLGPCAGSDTYIYTGGGVMWATAIQLSSTESQLHSFY